MYPIQKNSAQSDHFEGGVYKFNSIILNWTLEEISSPLHDLETLPKKYESESAYSSSDDEGGYNGLERYFQQAMTLRSNSNAGQFSESQTRESYYESFKRLILEEARATLHQGIELYNQGKSELIKMKHVDLKMAKSTGNPCTLIVKGRLPDDIQGRTALGVLVKVNRGDFFIGIAHENDQGTHLHIKIILSEEVRMTFNERINDSYNELLEWEICVLGSLITHRRMYEVCHDKPHVSFLQQIITGRLNDWGSSHLTYRSSRTSQQSLRTANRTQKAVITKFLQSEKGIYLLQGPPGTGKTTTIVALLNELCEKEKRVLVCAPSNKAVHVIAGRFQKKHPERSTALAGVDNKLKDESLRFMFVHSWTTYMAKQFNFIKTKLRHKLDIDRSSSAFTKILRKYRDQWHSVKPSQL